MNLKSFFLIFIFLISLNGIFALGGESNFHFLNFFIDENSDTNKVSYELIYNGELQTGDIFKVEIYFNSELVDESCVKELSISSDILFTKFVCEVPKNGEGEYTFIGKIIRDGEEINVDLTKQYINSDGSSASLVLDNNYDDKTIIYIEVNSESEDLIVKSRIPKSVIENLDEDNRDELIYSELEYEILESDPLIAWSIEKAPAKINYTINKKVSNEDLENFQIEVENSAAFKGLNYILILVILLIIFLVFRPLLKKIRK